MKKALFAFFACALHLSASESYFPLELQTQVKNTMVYYQDFPKGNPIFGDITPVLQTPHLFEAIIDHLAERYKGADLDAVVALEARGFPFGAPLAYKLHLPLVIVRKAGKLPGDVYRSSYKKIYGEDTFEMSQHSLKPGDRVIILDDFFSTGGSLNAARELVELSRATVYEGASLFNNKEAPYKLSFPFPIYSLVEFESPFSKL